eukprot:s8249_g2.t1
MKNHPDLKCARKCEKRVSRSVIESVRMKKNANVKCDHGESGSVGSDGWAGGGVGPARTTHTLAHTPSHTPGLAEREWACERECERECEQQCERQSERECERECEQKSVSGSVSVSVSRHVIASVTGSDPECELECERPGRVVSLLSAFGVEVEECRLCVLILSSGCQA